MVPQEAVLSVKVIVPKFERLALAAPPQVEAPFVFVKGILAYPVPIGSVAPVPSEFIVVVDNPKYRVDETEYVLAPKL
jgi:hypothetical protein